jgi:hypothetical protein
MILVGVKRLSPEEKTEVEQAVAGARASFEAVRGLGPPTLRTDSDLATYTVLEDDGLTSEQRDVIAPLNEELSPGSEVAFEGQVSTLFCAGEEDVTLRFAERIVATDWEAFWSQ